MGRRRSRSWWGGVALLSACGSEGGSGAGPHVPTLPTGGAGAGGAPATATSVALPRPERVDLLFMLDNSRSMDVKHQLFADAAHELVRRLRTPDCVDDVGVHSVERDASGACLSGQSEFEAATDLHVAVITSSLGDGGDNQICRNPEETDMGRVMGSTTRGAVASMNTSGFLEWRTGGDASVFDRDLESMITAVGQVGCGFEASLEAWFRFLIDPEPYASLTRVACNGGGTGTDCVAPARDEAGQKLIDTVLLEQRAAFLRPDSLVMVVSLSDENDCSIRVGGQSWLLSSYTTAATRAASVCASDPNSECCYACGSVVPDGCAADPICDTEPRLTQSEDNINLRCFEQKQRFGVSFLYPTERYVRALSAPRLCLLQPSLDPANCPGEVIDNPLFAHGRPQQYVTYTSIIGVPTGRIAGDALGEPVRFQTLAKLQAQDWDQLLGKPHASPPVLPGDPFMRESTSARAGIDPGNAINGREYDTHQDETGNDGGPRDLEYACIFPLPQAINCALRDRNANEPCDCYDGVNDSPLCEASPGASSPGEMQYFGKAYPGLRHLEVLQGLSRSGATVTLGSICAANTSRATEPSFGYRPSVQSLLESVQPLLRTRL
jgi:hypothetical protein